MLVSVASFLIVLSILVLVHELGHFVAAKKAGILVEEFGFGIPPRLVGKKVGETIYSINFFPFGGFVRLHGENYGEKIEKPERAFLSKSRLQRAAIISAGVFMNFLLGIIVFAGIYTYTGIPTHTEETGQVRVVGIQEGSPADSAGLMEGDIISKIAGEDIESTSKLQTVVDTRKGLETQALIERDGESVEITLTPRKEYPEGEGPIGIAITSSKVSFYKGPLWQRPLLGVYYGLRESMIWGVAIVMGLYNLFAQLFTGTVPQDIAGPVGIYAITTEAAQQGVISVANLLAILSINLGILNIVPFPALDGGRLLFVGLETVLGKKVYPKLEAAIHAVGMVILILLLLAITAHDIRRLIQAGGVSGFIDQVLQ